jgi:hypothetical protein
MSQQSTTGYSARSQRSIILESNLRKEIRKVGATIDRFRKKLPELEQSKASLTKMVVVQDQSNMQPQLDMTLLEIANVHGVIKACEEERSRTEEAVKKLDPSPVEVQARLIRQRNLAALAEGRQEQDEKVDRLLKELRQVLDDRAQLTAEMSSAAEALELAIPKDDLDTRLEKLSASLPADLLAASERWHCWFLGKPNGTRPYRICDEHLVVPETLAHNGLYHFGDTIQLTEGEAQLLSRADRPAPKRRAMWTYAPPSVMTVEAFAAAVRTAKEKGVSVQDICFWREVELDAAARERFKVDMRAAPAAREPAAQFESTMKIKGRMRARLLRDRQYEVGDIIELTREPDAWNLVEAGLMGPP